MFTGIVQDLVQVVDVQHQSDISRLSLDLGDLAAELQSGASVAVNGTCLTVTACQDSVVNFDVIQETLTNTNLGQLHKGQRVNVERSFKVGDEIGGHIVSGHVSGVSRVLERRVSGHDHVLRLSMEPNWQEYVFQKGFVAVDGASLTVSQVEDARSWFEISLIPETLQRTTLGLVDVGDQVNIEVEAQTVTTVETVKKLVADPAWLDNIRAALGKAAE